MKKKKKRTASDKYNVSRQILDCGSRVVGARWISSWKIIHRREPRYLGCLEARNIALRNGNCRAALCMYPSASARLERALTGECVPRHENVPRRGHVPIEHTRTKRFHRDGSPVEEDTRVCQFLPTRSRVFMDYRR